MHKGIPCVIMRGGTSKGLYMLEKDLPVPGRERDDLLLRLMGSPDARQIDGLGGGASTTSKVAILATSSEQGIDIDYTFAQVSVDKPIVSYAGNCGNISAGVGPFAIECGLVKTNTPTTTVRIFNTNTRKLMIEEIQTPNGVIAYSGDMAIPGVPGTAAPVKMVFINPSGTMGRGLLPTGNAIDRLVVPGFGALEVSIVDASNPLVFVRAANVGLTGQELPREIDKNPALLDLLEHIRGAAAQLLGLVDQQDNAALKSPGIPKLTIVSEPIEYISTLGVTIEAGAFDLLARMMSMQFAHPTYAMTGAICTSAAAVIPGSIVQKVRRDNADTSRLRIGQPGGVLETGVTYSFDSIGNIVIESAYGYRTARLLMKGTAFA